MPYLLRVLQCRPLVSDNNNNNNQYTIYIMPIYQCPRSTSGTGSTPKFKSLLDGHFLPMPIMFGRRPLLRLWVINNARMTERKITLLHQRWRSNECVITWYTNKMQRKSLTINTNLVFKECNMVLLCTGNMVNIWTPRPETASSCTRLVTNHTLDWRSTLTCRVNIH